MTIYVDGDACPVTLAIESVGAELDLPVVVVSDTAHVQQLTTAHPLIVDIGPGSADFAIVNNVKPGDVVVTNDLGLVALLLAKRVRVVSHLGEQFHYRLLSTSPRVSRLMAGRRAAGGRTLPGNDEVFAQRLRRLLLRWTNAR